MTDTTQDICKADTIGVIWMSDLISRQAVLDGITASINQFGGRYTTDMMNMWGLFTQMIQDMPSAQQDCTECAEYDHETHSCPKYCDVIRRTMEEAQKRTYTIDYVHHEGITKAEGKG